MVERTGQIDFDSRGLILEAEEGERIRLVGAKASALLIGDEVTVRGEVTPGGELEVQEVVSRWQP